MTEPGGASRRERIEKRFGASAGAYAASEGHRGGPDLDRLIELAAPQPGETLLDIATGAGNTALAFAPLVGHVVAADLSVGMIHATRGRFAEAGRVGTFTVADAERLPFADGTFDLVVCRIAPHHFLDPAAAFAEAARVLVPDGRFLMVDSASPDDPDAERYLHDAEVLRDPTHVRALRPAGWAALCEAAGLTVRSVEVVRKRHDFEAWVARGGVSDAVARELRQRFLAAPAAAVAALAIEIEDGAVRAFTDDKVVLASRKGPPIEPARATE